MRHLKEFEKLVILLSFQKKILMLKVTGTLTGLIPIFCWDYSVHNLHSKRLFLFSFPWFAFLLLFFHFCLFVDLAWLCFSLFSHPWNKMKFYSVFAFSYLSINIARVIQERVC